MYIATINMKNNRLCHGELLFLKNTVQSFQETNKQKVYPAVFFVWFLCLWFHMKI